MKNHSTLIGMVCILAILSSAPALAAKKKAAGKPEKKTEAPVDKGKTAAGLKVEDVTPGTGPEAVSGKEVTVHYTGKLTNGKKFDSSLDRKQPFKFILGAGQVISGWDKGVAGMKVGGKRKLTIPPDMGYGKNGVPGVIPPDSTLVFDVELIAVGS